MKSVIAMILTPVGILLFFLSSSLSPVFCDQEPITEANFCLNGGHDCMILVICNYDVNVSLIGRNLSSPLPACAQGTIGANFDLKNAPFLTLTFDRSSISVPEGGVCPCVACNRTCFNTTADNTTTTTYRPTTIRSTTTSRTNPTKTTTISTKTTTTTCKSTTVMSSNTVNSTTAPQLGSALASLSNFSIQANACIAESAEVPCTFIKLCNLRLFGIQPSQELLLCYGGLAVPIASTIDLNNLTSTLTLTAGNLFQSIPSLGNNTCNCNTCRTKCVSNILSS